MSLYIPGEPASGAFGEPRLYGRNVPCGLCGQARRGFSISMDGIPECVVCVGDRRRRIALLALIAEATAVEGQSVDADALRLLAN